MAMLWGVIYKSKYRVFPDKGLNGTSSNICAVGNRLDNKFFADVTAPPPMESMGGGGQQPQGGGGTPPTNQSGVEQTMQEAQLTEGMGA